jgi:hypothetical protein
MKKPEWPGIATAVGVLFVLTITIALAGDSDFKLKEWQTLLAACVALIAGSLAYYGAMAKVEFDREIAARDLNRK